MPPKKHKPNADFDLRSDHVATVPSNDGVITTSTDTNHDSFSHPNVMLMTIAKLKSELNRLQVCIVGNPGKNILQAKLLTAYRLLLVSGLHPFF